MKIKGHSTEGSLLKKSDGTKDNKETDKTEFEIRLAHLPEIMSAQQVAEVLGVTARTVGNYRNLNWLTSVCYSSHKYQFLKSDLIRFILSRRQEDVFDREIPKFKIVRKEKKKVEEVPELFR